MRGILIQTISIPEKVCLPNGRTKWKEVNLKMLITEFKEGIRYIYLNETFKKLLLGPGLLSNWIQKFTVIFFFS